MHVCLLNSVYVHNEPLHFSANHVAKKCRISLPLYPDFNKLTRILFYHNFIYRFLCLYTPQAFKFLICQTSLHKTYFVSCGAATQRGSWPPHS